MGSYYDKSIENIVKNPQYKNKAFKATVITMLTKLHSKIEQQTGMINELLSYTRKTAVVSEKPHGTPNFPLRTVEDFYSFETILETNNIIRDYMIQRLSALGGSSIEGHTRRCLSYILTNELAILFNWKGRDKLAFEKSQTMGVIFDAVRRHYPAEEGTDLKVANRTKDWLKYAKARCKGNRS